MEDNLSSGIYLSLMFVVFICFACLEFISLLHNKKRVTFKLKVCKGCGGVVRNVKDGVKVCTRKRPLSSYGIIS